MYLLKHMNILYYHCVFRLDHQGLSQVTEVKARWYLDRSRCVMFSNCNVYSILVQYITVESLYNKLYAI